MTTLEDATRIARRVLGGAHPVATEIHYASQDAKLTLLDRQCDEMSHFNLKHSREMEVREVALGRQIAAMRIQKPILLRRWAKAYHTMAQLGRAPDVHWDRLVFP